MPSGDEVSSSMNRNDGTASSDSSISDSWFIGIFGMWFWAANLDSFWRDAARDEADGTNTGVLEIKALDQPDDLNRTCFFCMFSTFIIILNSFYRRGLLQLQFWPTTECENSFSGQV